MDARRFLWILVIAALLTMVVMLMLQRAAGPPPERPAPAATREAPTAPATATAPARPEEIKSARASPPPAAPAAKAKWAYETHEAKEALLGSPDKRSGYKMQLELTSLGAAIKTIKLSEHFATVQDKRRHKRDPETYQQAVAEDPKLKGNYPLLNAVSAGGRRLHPLATRKVRFPAAKLGLNMSGPRWRAGQVKTAEDGTQSVTFTARIDRNGKPYVRLAKTYTLRKGSYSVGVSLKAVNLLDADEAVELELTQFAATGVPREDFQSDNRMVVYGQHAGGPLKVRHKGVGEAKKMSPGVSKATHLGPSQGPVAVVWLGPTNKFFAALTRIVPEKESPTAASFYAAAVQESPTSVTFLPWFTLGPYTLNRGQAKTITLDLFAGPKRRDLLNQPPYKSLLYEDSVVLGPCAWGWLSKAMMWLLFLFSRIPLFNYGLAIILLVVLVRLALHPLTRKGQVSMMALQKLQPQMQALRDRYKDDKAKLNQEMMKLYKSAGASPFLGCLPMLLQMPIWIALWTGIRAAVELRHEAFLPFWIIDLAAPDKLIDFGRVLFTFPLIGSVRSFNLLPLLLAVGMFLNQKLAPTTAAPTAGQQQSTQKQMMYMMNGFFLLIFYNAPSGLTMYIMASMFAGAAEQYLIRKHIREREAVEAAAETRVAIPGKRFRGQKPKKPKGPFRLMR